MKKLVPNIVTSLNLLCGSIAVISAINDQLVKAALFILLGIFFDFFDGFIARLLKSESPLGFQLDSISDMVTSGLAPGIIMFQLLSNSLTESSYHSTIIPYFSLLIVLGSAFRLARYNISKPQSIFFTGLPTPANAMFVIGLTLVREYSGINFFLALLNDPFFLLILTLILTFLLNSNFKLITFKFETYGIKENFSRYCILLMSLISLIFFDFAGISLSIMFYFVISLIYPPINKN